MSTITRVLIANRGEIAVRIARSIQAAGMKAVAVYSDPDRESPHVAACDTAIALNGSQALDSYLDIDKVLHAAQISGADAVHPGYGFLSENAEFAEQCEAAGLNFIGPTPAAIRLMGSKRAAKDAVSAAGVPCIKGYDGADQNDAELIKQAQRIGFPVMVKASSGGGGRGMRLVRQENELADAIVSARLEAQNAFGDGELILEQAITTGRHVEIQVAADSHGNVIHLGERDCSLQRRHQKVIEEAPSPFVDETLRTAMGEAAVNAAKSCDYLGVGTVEFLVAEDASFSFLEMNTRLQVEHPVTELVSGIDLVDLQLCIASGEALPLSQEQVSLRGHAIEARIYAEDPALGFVPQTGLVHRFTAPEGAGVRVDSGVASGNRVSAYYDPMLAKIMAYGSTREQARMRLRQALADTTLLGVGTNQQFLHSLLDDPVFVAGDATITYLDEHSGIHSSLEVSAELIAAAAVVSVLPPTAQADHFLNWSNAEPMLQRRALRMNGQDVSVGVLARDRIYDVSIDEEVVTIGLDGYTDNSIELVINGALEHFVWSRAGDEFFLQCGALQLRCEDTTYAPAVGPNAAASGEVAALTEGLLVAIEVAVGDQVKQGQTLAVVEAMKMQHRHTAEANGTVESIGATLDAQVSKGQILLTLSLDNEESEPTENKR